VPRYEANRLGYSVPSRTVLSDPGRYLEFPRRDLSNPAHLEQLLVLCEGLEAWAQRFQPTSPMFAMAAASISDASVGNLLDCINNDIAILAPTRSSRRRSDDGSPLREGADARTPGLARVEVLLNVLMHLREYVAGTFEAEPDAVDEHGEIAAWHRSWRPPDEEIVTFVREQVIELRELARLDITPRHMSQLHSRLASLARRATLDLKKRLNSPSEEAGLKMATRLTRRHARADAIQARHEFAAALGGLAKVASEKAGAPFVSGRWWAAAVGLLASYDGYSDKCLPLLRSLPMTRTGLQKKREQLEGWLAIVIQYAFVVRGNAQRLKCASVCEGIRLAAREICEQLRALCPGMYETPPKDSIHQAVRRYDQLILDPDLLSLWKRRLGEKSKQCGLLTQTITDEGRQQLSPWTLGDHVRELRAAGVLNRRDIRGRKDQLQQLLFSMQKVGLAVQVPWPYISGEVPDLPLTCRRDLLSRRGLGWLVNPFGAALHTSDEAAAVEASARPASQSLSRRKPTRKAKRPVHRA
jgi:hypothetical protein